MKSFNLAEKKNSYNALKVLMFLTLLGVSESSRCLQTPVPVPRCPQSSYQWHIRSKDICRDHSNYHCLITELGKQDPNYTIECCMKPETISTGHMPRYNLNKQDLQEIECESDYFMPVSFESNKYRENGVEHCNHKKSKCTNMEGLKVCSDGSTTMDATCYCDYINMYVPELPLAAGEFCFKEQHNNCHLRQKCEEPNGAKPQELNMMYECVDACPDGQYRPEMALACEDIVQSTTLSFNITSQLPSQVPVQTPTKVPILVTTNDMKKTGEMAI
ncbi:Hypothetical predicted protein [Mytilus galloprovincialis]|uniref:Uncharacterized protein n=1 Tax=Mytilus galloprovincialis TaxID=29158 RepID=A0A8B6BQE5_MYTGA|nr:Hypothetical predicted protein [Mytilus galloprovincialis]